jgi:hypothetical protein
LSSTAPDSAPEVKAQHYIPKFYLKGFMDERRILWVLDKGNPPRPSRPKAEAHRSDFYTFHERGYRDETAEHALTVVENAVAPIIRKIARVTADLTQPQIASLYAFVAVMFTRVPAWRSALDKMAAELMRQKSVERARDKKQFEDDYKKVFGAEHGEKELSTEAEKLRQMFLSGEWTVEQKSVGFNLQMMFDSAFTVARALANRGCQILLAPPADSPEESAFLTSDNPVFTVQPDSQKEANVGVGFGLKGVEVYMPLNKHACLKIVESDVKQLRTVVSQAMVKQINRVVMLTAPKSVYSSRSERRLARLFDEYGCKVAPGENAFIPPGRVRAKTDAG